jgi:hypothetical protein
MSGFAIRILADGRYRDPVPSTRTALIQTVGWETLPAVTAALALRPAAIGHVHMPDSTDASRRAADAIGAVLPGVPVDHRVAGIDDPLAEAREAVHALARVLREKHACERVIVHVTGSTKLLAIGAYDAARADGHECVYLELPHDDEDGVPQVVSLGTGRLGSDEIAALGLDPSVKMSLELVARAHGFALPEAGEDFSPFIAFAREALEDVDAEEALHRALPAAGGERSPWPDDPRWQLWREPFYMSGRLRELALACGIVEESGDCVRVADPGRRVERARRRKVFERNASLLRGAWLEVALADAMRASPVLRDVRWSVEAEEPRPMEHDVLALKGTTLVVASAKRSPQPGIFGHLRELKAHAQRLGGMKGIPVLAVARTDPRRVSAERVSVIEDLGEVCETLGIRTVGREEIVARELSGAGL